MSVVYIQVREVTSDCRGSVLGPECRCWLLIPGSWQAHTCCCLVLNNTLVLPGKWLCSNVKSLFYMALGNIILKYSFASHLVGGTRRLAEHKRPLNTQLPSERHNAVRDHLWSVLLFPPPTTHPNGPATPCDSQKDSWLRSH